MVGLGRARAARGLSDRNQRQMHRRSDGSYPLYSEAVVEGMEDMVDVLGLLLSCVNRSSA